MSNPKSSALQAVLDRVNTDAPEEVAPEKPEAGPLTGKSRTKKAAAQRTKRAGGNEPGKRVLIGGHFPPNVARQLALISAEDSITKQDLLAEALDLLFVKKGKARIVDL